MKPSLSLLIILCLGALPSFAQNIYDARQTVILQATIQEDPPMIVLNWKLDTVNGGYTIWRKAKNDLQWGDSIAVTAPGSTTWTDTAVNIGNGYEYQVLKSLPLYPYGDGGANFGAGYIYAGIRVPPVHHRGACLVVIDSTFKQTLAPEINRLLKDLEADGWRAQALYVDRNDPVTTVKSYIQLWAATNQDFNRTLFLLGRVPVPYSGDIVPDGHYNDHKGAWPCDGYYANLDGVWTDQTVNITTSPGTRNDNVPGDGKFDNSVIPTAVALQVGRVDFANMSLFPESEEQLLRRYLNKDHLWRTGFTPVVERGLVDNNFPAYLDGHGGAGWRNFAPMFGLANVFELQYRQTLTNQSYLWSYGCGGGGPQSASDISSTTYFTTDSLQTVFTMLFGSYFGDWDYPNNFLRGAIASRTCLASTWGNRPEWILHHMALGENIGYGAQLTMNNRGLYTPRFYGGYASTALMGDPTLRMHMFRSVENLVASQVGLHVQLDWLDPAGAMGYYIYKKTAFDTAFQLLNQVPVMGTTYLDTCAGAGLFVYMVRSVELRSSASGTYYNLSAGITVDFQSAPSAIASVVVMDDTGSSNGSIAVSPQAGCPPYHYIWNTGQTTSEITGLAAGVYCVALSDCGGCAEVYCATVELTTSAGTLPGLKSSKLYPNPVGDEFVLEMVFENSQDLQLDVTNAQGTKMSRQIHRGKDVVLTWDVRSLPPGYYWLQVKSVEGSMVFPFVKVGE
ncbi:MAG: T9SS type A sorting domain-containing protein [Saprospiraceae bacterium]|nr:T9SS type A sorting domain-containing protein [Saprospiraceae bacterium]